MPGGAASGRSQEDRLRMNLNPKWVPMKWPCGPLEIARRKRSKGGQAVAKSVLEAWTRPSVLELLKGTPVNCLIVDWAAGEAEDAAQQAALKPLLEAGGRLGISFVGRVSGKGNWGGSVGLARAAGLSAVLLEGSGGQEFDFPVIRQFETDQVKWASASEIFCSTGNAWPGVKLKNTSGDTAYAGPTGVPWVNSNGWLSLLAREMAPGKLLWVDAEPPGSSSAAHPADYCLAIADSWVYASRWIVSLDDSMREALLKRQGSAMEAWTRIGETLSFFAKHPQWETYKPMGILAVISDFQGENAFMGGEVLNLLNRRQVQFLVMDRPRALAGPLGSLRAVLWVDKEPPTASQHAKLLALVRQGGLLIAATYWGPAGVAPFKKDWLFGYNLYKVGKGRIVVPEAGFQDPYQVARDTHLLVGRRNDLVRLYNPGSTNAYASVDPEGRTQLVQVMNYSRQPANYVTLWVNAKARMGRLEGPGQKPASLKGFPARKGTNFHLPTLAVNCAVEFARSHGL